MCQTARRRKTELCSNRTFMELKSKDKEYRLKAAEGSNRTFMELK